MRWRPFKCFYSIFIFSSSRTFSAKLCPLWAKLMLRFSSAQFKCVWEPHRYLLLSPLRGVPISDDVSEFPSQPLLMMLEKAFVLDKIVLSSCKSNLCLFWGIFLICFLVVNNCISYSSRLRNRLRDMLYKRSTNINNPFLSVFIPSLAGFQPASSSTSDCQYFELSFKVSEMA